LSRRRVWVLGNGAYGPNIETSREHRYKKKKNPTSRQDGQQSYQTERRIERGKKKKPHKWTTCRIWGGRGATDQISKNEKKKRSAKKRGRVYESKVTVKNNRGSCVHLGAAARWHGGLKADSQSREINSRALSDRDQKTHSQRRRKDYIHSRKVAEELAKIVDGETQE